MTFDKAQRAIYIDFESTARTGDRPALLGVVRPGGAVTQYVVDPALANAVPAHPDCRRAALPDVLEQLAAECADGRHLVSWSRFDLQVIEASRAVPSVARALRAAHFNALDLVPNWGLTYGFRADPQRFAGRNQLHKFFPLAGYRPDWHYENAAPAAWIRHVRTQMAANGGHYQRVNRPTKRDWHQLLTYNRHDCLGLRHLVLRAAAETEKRRAYLEATYAVDTRIGIVNFKIGAKKDSVDKLLTRYAATSWAHVTACNPGLATRSPADNDSANQKLADTLRHRRYTVLAGDGHDDSGRWPTEPAWFVVGIDEADARRLAREFGQWAIVTGRIREAARLVWCLDRGPDLLVTRQLQAASDASAD
jgi:hypothetical protein